MKLIKKNDKKIIKIKQIKMNQIKINSNSINKMIKINSINSKKR